MKALRSYTRRWLQDHEAIQVYLELKLIQSRYSGNIGGNLLIQQPLYEQFARNYHLFAKCKCFNV